MRLIAGALTLGVPTVSVGAQTSRLGDVVARLDGYLQGYEDRLANIVAEETYRQWVEQGQMNRRSTTSRMLRSDFALTPTSERNSWVGYRDTFEVDGAPVRDRDERLQRLLSSGAVGQAARIAEQNARFNPRRRSHHTQHQHPDLCAGDDAPAVSGPCEGAPHRRRRSGWPSGLAHRISRAGPPYVCAYAGGAGSAPRVVALTDIQTAKCSGQS